MRACARLTASLPKTSPTLSRPGPSPFGSCNLPTCWSLHDPPLLHLQKRVERMHVPMGVSSGATQGELALLQKVLELTYRQWAAADGRNVLALTHLLNS